MRARPAPRRVRAVAHVLLAEAELALPVRLAHADVVDHEEVDAQLGRARPLDVRVRWKERERKERERSW